jgi:hypothetical protein
MENIRIPINLNTAQNVTFKLEQDFEQLEILSLKVSAYDVYAQMTSDFGVVVGRVNVNGGFGVQNTKVSVFVPITSDDELRSEITQLYPFKSPLDKLPNGVRYNLFPRVKQANFSHQPIGCFPDVSDLTYYPVYLEIYEKYYKFTTTTNDSGDYMIFGVPLGAQYVHMDFDLFDTKSFYITADDLVTEIKTSATISAQLSTELTQAINPNFELTTGGTYSVRVKADLDAMPNIFSDNKMVNVVPFWGDKTLHEIGITRCDFELNYQYVPTSILFGSYLNMSYWSSIKPDSSVDIGNGDAGWDITKQEVAKDLKVVVYKHLAPQVVERYGVYSQVPDISGQATGVFVLNLPMYEDYYITDEFGQLVPSKTKRGVPTKGHYVFEFFDDYEGIYGNGRRTLVGGSDGSLSVGIRVPADRNGHLMLGGWTSNRYDDSTLFEYNILKGTPRFYTVQTNYRPHQGRVYGNGFNDVDVRYVPNNANGNGVIAYIPKINTDLPYNIPIDGGNPSLEPNLLGTLISPRFWVQDYEDQMTLIYSNEVTWVPWYSKEDTSFYQTKIWDWIYGVGVKRMEGINRSDVYNALYPPGSGSSDNDISKNLIAQTWFFGDNPWDVENVPIANYYAQLLSQKPDATNRNINSIHNRFNLAVSNQFTAGLFASSIIYGSSKILFETSIVDVTDTVQRLVKDSVYSSYKAGTDNLYEGKYYLFGRNDKTQNALNIIKERYFNE